MFERTAYMNGKLVNESEARINVYDLSVAQGAGAFTMTRSFNKKHWKVEQHIARLKQSCELLSIPLPDDFNRLPALIDGLTKVNEANFRDDDEYRMMWVVSPGTSKMYTDIQGTIPHSWLYGTIFPLRYTLKGFSKYFTEGVHCVTSKIQQVPDACVPSSSKHRSRLHFHLAQMQAPEGTWPIMKDGNGDVVEAPGANIVEVIDDTIVLHKSNALPGISLATVEELSHSLGWRVREAHYTKLPTSCQEVWLTGTPFSVLPVRSIDGMAVGAACEPQGFPGPRYNMLMAKWSEMVGVDIKQQVMDWDSQG